MNWRNDNITTEAQLKYSHNFYNNCCLTSVKQRTINKTNLPPHWALTREKDSVSPWQHQLRERSQRNQLRTFHTTCSIRYTPNTTSHDWSTDRPVSWECNNVARLELHNLSLLCFMINQHLNQFVFSRDGVKHARSNRIENKSDRTHFPLFKK